MHLELIPDPRVDPQVAAFVAALRVAGFAGDIECDPGSREIASTDNSIYQVAPVAIVYPRERHDINRIVKAASEMADPVLSLTARGGNTGTNGQSLNTGVIVDFARHMNRILAIDPVGRRVTVEPGVVLDQLNSALAEHGLFFPPMVSTASRATIGGMVATDASGKGSRRYGKTSDYIEALDVVLSDGQDWRVEAMSIAEAEALATRPGIVGTIHREVLRVCRDKADAIAAVFPDMNRGLTGYNLQKTLDAEVGRFCLASLLAGSEGTLALTGSIMLRVAARPCCRGLAVLRYDDFNAALRDVERILEVDPLAIEILDDKVLEAARRDVVWAGIEAVLGNRATRPVNALLFVEFAQDDPGALDARMGRLGVLAQHLDAAFVDMTTVRDGDVIARLWRLREKAVGLLGRLGGARQGVPFVEDTAVPAGQLAPFVAAFRALLDEHGLHYGMFGHADVGCLHVRPFLNMKDPAQAALIRPLSDAVAQLAHRHGGLLWGEHGRGFRGEYSPFFFGPELYAELERVKAAFDPGNLFNPGKLASPAAGGRVVDRIDEVAFRGHFDREIPAQLVPDFAGATACNGNGACFSWDAADLLCPSYKASRDRSQSPKGRAALLRGWARAESGVAGADALRDLEAATARSLATCLSCKACASLCPVQVDIPAMKSRFLERYHARHGRPVRHRLLARAETLFALGRRLPALANAVMTRSPVRGMSERLLGLADLPLFSRGPALRVPVFDGAAFDRSDGDARRTVVLVEDSFTASFDSGVPAAAAAVLRALGYAVYRLGVRPNGKILHLLGMREAFARLARARVAQCEAVARRGIRLVGLDAATALMFEQEYRELVPAPEVRVIGLERLLAGDLAAMQNHPFEREDVRGYALFGHCTESALRPEALSDWQRVLAAAGMSARPVRTGCCGMAGLFGHERANRAMSERLFALSWQGPLETAIETPLATGFSCRSQVERMSGFRPMHPIEVLAARITGHNPA